MRTTLTPAEVFPPGEYLRDELEERGWTVTEFAEIIGRPVQAVSEILNNKKEITTETAIEFAEAFGTTPLLWLNLQTSYRVWLRGHSDPAAEPSPVARKARLRNLVPLAEVRKRGWIADTSDLDETESSVCELLGIDAITDQPMFALAARRSNSADPISIEQTAWLAHVRRVGATKRVAEFDRVSLADFATCVPRAVARGPESLSLLPPLFAECGVILVFCEGLKGGKLDGAVTFLDDGRPMMALTTRGNRFDGLIFTMLHECAHLTLEHLTPEHPLIVEYDIAGATENPIEAEANHQAHDWMFPDGLATNVTTLASICEIATDLGVHPSVVVGQVQRSRQQWNLHRTSIPKVRPSLEAAGLLD